MEANLCVICHMNTGKKGGLALVHKECYEKVKNDVRKDWKERKGSKRSERKAAVEIGEWWLGEWGVGGKEKMYFRILRDEVFMSLYEEKLLLKGGNERMDDNDRWMREREGTEEKIRELMVEIERRNEEREDLRRELDKLKVVVGQRENELRELRSELKREPERVDDKMEVDKLESSSDKADGNRSVSQVSVRSNGKSKAVGNRNKTGGAETMSGIYLIGGRLMRSVKLEQRWEGVRLGKELWIDYCGVVRRR
eukprot:Pompholyxophrys_punicea_v1_NODE_112_length_3406_cov_30.176067.p2 type:complete len:253 gc:universal NODE_112_length_3406_cov_30.176067:2311-1553(-)